MTLSSTGGPILIFNPIIDSKFTAILLDRTVFSLWQSCIRKGLLLHPVLCSNFDEGSVTKTFELEVLHNWGSPT